jgi:catechol 2,3-dioxygenase-like lactoylglutathione lyase family enzyme
MLTNRKAIATAAVRDLAAARRFYEGQLGLLPSEQEMEGVVTYKGGGASLLVYESRHAGTNRATSVTWDCGADTETVAKALAARGVAFERYEAPGMTLRGDVYVSDRMKVAWFKDPDGNVHALVGT